MAGASRALSERAVRAADLGAARPVAVGAGRRASPDQIERAGGPIVRRAHAAEHFRRRRCHLRAQAAPARRTGRRFAMASPEIRRHLPLRGRGRRRQRRAGRHRAARRPRARDTANVHRRRPLSAGRGRRGRGSDHRLDRQPRKPDLPGNDPSRARPADGEASRAQSQGDLLEVSGVARDQRRRRPLERSHGGRRARGGAHRHHAADRR